MFIISRSASHDRSPTGSPPRLLLLLALALPLGCSSEPAPNLRDLARESGERARATIVENVPDRARREQALRLLDRAIATEFEFAERQEILSSEIFELNAGYDTDRMVFRRAYDDLAVLRARALEDLLGPVGALEVLLKPDEWNAVLDTLEESQGNWSSAQ